MSNLDGQPGLQARGHAPQVDEQRAQHHPQGAQAADVTTDRFALQRALLAGGIAGVSRAAQPS